MARKFMVFTASEGPTSTWTLAPRAFETVADAEEFARIEGADQAMVVELHSRGQIQKDLVWVLGR